MSLKVLDQGLITTVQDLGRIGYQQYGIPRSGVMDELAAKIANLLIGNNENDAVIEMTVIGPTLQFQADVMIAICGADLSAAIDNKKLPLWRPLFIKRGSILRFGRPIKGCRAYLAIAGGIDVPHIMNSRSTYIRGGFGGYQGRILQRNDILRNSPLTKSSKLLFSYFLQNDLPCPFATGNWTVSTRLTSYFEYNSEIRFLKGPHYEQLNEESKLSITSIEFIISTHSDRMGYRLNGPKLKFVKPLQLLSEPVPFGTIQVPDDGQLIILMADRQTIGGYPKVGYIATVDLPKLAQMMPGRKMTLKELSIEEAQQQLIEVKRNYLELKNGIQLAIRRVSKYESN